MDCSVCEMPAVVRLTTRKNNGEIVRRYGCQECFDIQHDEVVKRGEKPFQLVVIEEITNAEE